MKKVVDSDTYYAEYSRFKAEARKQLASPKGTVPINFEFYEVTGGLAGDGEPVEMGVYGTHMGTFNLDRAREYVKKMSKAIDLADSFKYNGYIVDYGGKYGKDD